MDHSLHTMLAGESATNFANDMGFKVCTYRDTATQPHTRTHIQTHTPVCVQVETLTTANSSAKHNAWVNANCQPNFRKNVLPDPTTSWCSPLMT